MFVATGVVLLFALHDVHRHCARLYEFFDVLGLRDRGRVDARRAVPVLLALGYCAFGVLRLPRYSPYDCAAGQLVRLSARR
jgi:hypothetical protein